MNTVCRPAAILFCLLLFPVLSHGAVRYAAPAASGNGSCSGWNNACTLQTALTDASSGDEIWIKAGIHKPTTNPADRAATFRLVSNVAVYGGFYGNETARAQRNVNTNVTTLSGDIGTQGNSSDNSYHVVTSYVGTTGVTNSILDGVTISGGYADTGYSYGGGLICRYSSSLTLTNCTFSGNYASISAGGLYFDGDGSLILDNCTFSNNSALNGGGLYTAASGSLTLNNCTFSRNFTISTGNGGGIYQNGGSLTLNSCTFTNNSAHSGGGMLSSNISGTASTALTNCTFNGNSASSFGGGMSVANGSSPLLTNCTFSGNSASSGGGMFTPNTPGTTIRNSIFWGDSSESFGTAAVTYSIVQNGYAGTGNSAADPLLTLLGDYGGGVSTMALLPGSPAIDAGVACPATDQRGMTRPQLGGCDIGAFEFRGFTLTVAIDGSGSVTSQSQDGINYACTKSRGGTCTPVMFAEGDSVTLTPTGSNSSFSSWSGNLTGSNNPGSIAMDSDKTVTATFNPDPATVMIDGDTTRYYAIGTALNTPTQDDVTIRARNLDFGETVLFTNSHSLRLRGGFTDADFTNQTSNTTIRGLLRIQSGKLATERLKIKP